MESSKWRVCNKDGKRVAFGYATTRQMAIVAHDNYIVYLEGVDVTDKLVELYNRNTKG